MCYFPASAFLEAFGSVGKQQREEVLKRKSEFALEAEDVMWQSRMKKVRQWEQQEEVEHKLMAIGSVAVKAVYCETVIAFILLS